MKKSLFYLNILVFIIIIANIYKPIERYFQWVVFPFEIVFSDIHEYIETSKINIEKFQEIEKELLNYEIEKKNLILVDVNTKPGVILSENGKYLRVKTVNKVDENSIVIDSKKHLVGFVESVLNDIVLVKKLGWSENHFFALMDNNDILVEEQNGYLYLELPENMEVKNKEVKIETPFYLEEIPITLEGKITSKIGDKFIFEPSKIDSSTVFIMEVD